MLSCRFGRGAGIAVAVVFVAFGCGGKVLVDTSSTSSGSGGGSSSSTGISSVDTGVTATAATGIDCAALEQDFGAKLAAAISCVPELNVIQCSGTTKVPDSCACPVIVNEHDSAAALAAQNAYDAWTGAGCGPYGCGKECNDYPGTSGYCQPQEDGSGICAPIYPD